MKYLHVILLQILKFSMFLLFQKFFKIGTRATNSEKLNEKIVLANQIILVLFVIPPTFLVLSLLYMPSLAFLPVLSLLILIGSLFLISNEVYNFSRIVVSIMPTMIGGTFYIASS